MGLGGLLSIAAVLTCYLSDLSASPNPAFFGGKMFEGVAVGMIICSTQTYLSEVVPTRLRAPVLALFPLIQMFGQLVSSLVVLGLMEIPGKLSYRLALALQWPFSAVPVILAIFAPESPNYLSKTTSIPVHWLLLKSSTASRDHTRTMRSSKAWRPQSRKRS